LTSGDNHKTDVAVIDFDPKDRYGKGLNVIHHKVIYLATKYVNESTPELYRDWLKMINESLTENIDESNYPRPEMQKTIALIAKNLVTPEERYWMIEEYNAAERERKEFENGELSKALTIAKNLIAMGLEIEAIVKVTGLTLSEIEKLGVPFLNDEEK
jgi:predicted transposase/invertase (TIGR01784 family)